jgi:hypothetical protein
MSKKRPHRNAGRNVVTIDRRGLSQQLGSILFEALMQAGEAGRGGAALTVERAETPTAPARLAAGQPVDAAGRAHLHEIYERCLHAYRTVVRARDAGCPQDDAGAALAYFVAANIGALQGVEPGPDVLEVLERQLLGVARLVTAWESASVAERQQYFETMATIGVLVTGMGRRARLEGGAVQIHVRRAARAYLVQLLGLEPDLLRLDAAGLSLRAPHEEAHAVAA